MKKIIIVNIILVLCFCASANVSAEESYNPGANKILVNKANNTITFIYDESDTKLMNQWNGLPRFNDVAENAWYQMYVSHLSQLGIIDGSVANFYPENNITRGDYLDMIVNVADANLMENPSTCGVGDVSFISDRKSVIQWAVVNDILPYDIDSFNLDEVISVKEATEILISLSEFQNSDALNMYLESVSRAESTAVAAGLQNFDNTIALSNSSSGVINSEVLSTKLVGNDSLVLSTDLLSRCEAAKMLSFYIVLNEKPTIITGTMPIEYIEVNTVETTVPMDDSDESFHHILAESDSVAEGEISPRWTSSGDVNTSVHERITNRGFMILFTDKNSSISNITGKYSPLARNYIYEGSVAPDYKDERGETQRSSAGHYCSPTLKNKFYQTDLTAYTNFNQHYYLAKMNYEWQDWPTAYDELGRAIHYMEDIISPPHAALIVGSDHSEYENWVKNNMRSDYFVYSAPNGTYNFMSTSTFRDISINFATYSDGVADECVYGSESLKVPFTRECLTKAQRAVAGLGYRFLIDTGRNN